MGSGCGSVGRVVASDSRDPPFESSHPQIFILNINCQLYWKEENKEKEGGDCPFLIKVYNIDDFPSKSFTLQFAIVNRFKDKASYLSR